MSNIKRRQLFKMQYLNLSSAEPAQEDENSVTPRQEVREAGVSRKRPLHTLLANPETDMLANTSSGRTNGKKPASDDTDEQAIAAEKAIAVSEINKDHFVASVGTKFCIMTESYDPLLQRFVTKPCDQRSFFLRYKNWKIGKDHTAASAWVESPDRREFKGVIFAPGRTVPGYYNLFRGFTVTPGPGDCSLYWQHILCIICRGNRRHYRYLRRWMAHLFQQPSELPGVAIVILGRQGTGKGIFVEPLCKLLGQHAMMLSCMSQLVGRFSGHLMDLILVNANEALWRGDKAAEGTLKAMITDATMQVEFKGYDAQSVANFKRLVVTSNENEPVPVGIDDRRFLVLETDDSRKEDKEYFGAIVEQLENGGLEALLHDLLSEDLAGFDVRTKPYSSYDFAIKLRSAEPLVKWWYGRLHEGVNVLDWEMARDGERWNATPCKSGLHENFRTFCEEYHLRSMQKAVFGKEFRKLLPGYVVGETRPNGGRRCHKLPSLAECRQAFERYAKAGPHIWEDGHDHEELADEDL